VPLELDVRKIVRYPPEIFLSALPLDLAVGDNTWCEYAGFAPYVVSLYGVSFARRDDLNFRVDADGVTDVVLVEDLGAVKGLDFEEEVKYPATRSLLMKITNLTGASITAYQLRHKIKVDALNVTLKLQLEMPLTGPELELAAKYGLMDKLAIGRPIPYDPYTGVETLHTVAKVMTASGTILDMPVPDGKKMILLDLACYRPAASAQAYVTLKRDDVPETVRIDPYCMQGLERPIGLWPRYSIRIVALDHMTLELDWTSGTHRIRAVYGLGKLTITEKIKWGIELTDEERETAERLDLFDRVRAGVI